MPEKIHQYAHYILYAKGHYERFQVDGTVWGDLKKIQAAYCGVEEEYISKNDISHCLINATEQVVDSINLLDFLSEINPDNVWKTWPDRVSHIKDIEYDFLTAVIGKCLSLLRFIRVIDEDGNSVIELGKADVNILEPKNSEKKEVTQ
jgi:hypothetical protein